MACNMPIGNVTFTFVNRRPSRDFTNVKAPAPTAQGAQSHRHETRDEPTTGDARRAGLGWAGGYASKAVARRATHSPQPSPALTHSRHTTEGSARGSGLWLWALQGWRGWGFYICMVTFKSLLLRKV